jgi:hypothetical protein
MHNARDHEQTHPDTSTIPSRRRLFTGLSATLLAGAAIATSAHGAPTVAPTGTADAELLELCAEFHHQHAAALATPTDDDAALTAALDERWEISDEILDAAATTEAGRRAKAHVALVLMVENEGAEPVDQASIFVLAALQDIVGSTAARIVPSAESADAELIRLCDRLVALEAKDENIYLTVEDDDEANRLSEILLPEFQELRDRIFALDAPTTRDGQRAFARAALAAAPRDSRGDVILDTGGGLPAFPAFGLAHSLAGSAVA